MNRPRFRLILLAGLLAACGCNPDPGKSGSAAPVPLVATGTNVEHLPRIREPAVAGLFYPADNPLLSRAVDGLLEQAPAHRIPGLRGLVCPHAGYVYSGQTAAHAYRALAGSDIRTVIILAASHYASFPGASIPETDAYRTPLGTVPISDLARQLAGRSPFVVEPRCQLQRPSWWRQAPKTAPADGADTPETWEHSVEVQVPFLQKTLKQFTILPIVFGDADPEEVARVLSGFIDDKTLVIASSDLSHYHESRAAKELDDRCVKAILNLDIDQMKTQEACGKSPILALMHLARQKGWKAQLLDSRNSGDVSGDKDRVVGYTAVAFHAPAPETVGVEERRFLLDLARKTLASVAANPDAPDPGVNAREVPPRLAGNQACFVTLMKNGELRGCIGHILPKAPLYQAVIDNARNAATRDWRFTPVQPDEVPQIRIEISVLTEPQPVRFNSPEELLQQLRPHEDGVVLRIGSRGATFLPQVWEQIQDKVEFLNRLAQKAGCEPSAWRSSDTSVAVYQVEAFQETE